MISIFFYILNTIAKTKKNLEMNGKGLMAMYNDTPNSLYNPV